MLEGEQGNHVRMGAAVDGEAEAWRRREQRVLTALLDEVSEALEPK